MRNGSADRQRRTGERLRAARERLGLSRGKAARRAGLGRRELAAYEKGRWRVPETTMARLAHTYGIPTGEVVPSRGHSTVQVDADRVSAGGNSRRLPPDPTPDDVLAEYLGLVRQLRGLEAADEMELRDRDLAALASALGDKPEEIEDRLVELVHCTREEARVIRRELLKHRLVAPAAGFFLGVGGLGAAAADADPSDAQTVEPQAVEFRAVDETAAESHAVEEIAAEEPDDQAVVEEPDDDWAELIPPLVIERDDADGNHTG